MHVEGTFAKGLLPRLGKRDALFMAWTLPPALVFLVPWWASFIQASGDDGFTFMSHVHYAMGIPWGTETMHSTGPWAMMRFPHYWPGVHWVLIVGHLATALTVGLTLAFVASRYVRTAWVACLYTWASVWLLFASMEARWFFIVLIYILFLPDFPRQRFSLTSVLLAAMVGFTFHTKGTFMFAGLFILLVVLVLELSHRRPPLNALWLFACIIVSGLLAGSSPYYMVRMLYYVWVTIEGYSETFSVIGPAYQVVGFLGVAALFMWVVLRAEWSKHGRRGIAYFLAYGAVVWMLYRSSFVRQDFFHVDRSFYTAVPFILTYSFVNREWLARHSYGLLFSERSWSRRVQIAGVVALVVPAIAIAVFRPTWYGFYFGWGRYPLKGIAALATTGMDTHRAEHARRSAEIRQRYPLGDFEGKPMSAFGMMQTPIVAHGIESAPGPTVASYEIWSMWAVLRWNEFLSSPDRPEHMLYSAAGLSASNALTLAANYEVARRRVPIVLERRDKPLDVRLENVFEKTVAWSQKVPIPREARGELLVARFRYQRTAFNKLISFVYQPPPAYIVMWHRGVVVGRIRLNRVLSSDGLVLAVREDTTWDARGERLHGMRHRPLTEVKRPTVWPITHVSFEMLHGIVRPEEIRHPEREFSWVFPGSTWRWYFEPRLRLRIDQVRFSGR